MKRAYLLPLVALAFAACSDQTPVQPNPTGGPSLYTGTIATQDVNLGGSGVHGNLPGAIFTSKAPVSPGVCSTVNSNIYATKQSVWLNGGPLGSNGPKLPQGDYYVAVTAPNGDLLGWSNTTGTPRPVHVGADGNFATCYQLWAIVEKASGVYASLHVTGYDNSPNNGHEYKVWISSSSGFENAVSNTDNFKVRTNDGQDDCIVREDCPEPVTGRLDVGKFYDANANGVWDEYPALLTGWKMEIADGIDIFRYTTVNQTVDPDDYTVTEQVPTQTNWMITYKAEFPAGTNQITTATALTGSLDPVRAFTISVGESEVKAVLFGNVCLGAGHGYTLGFWSNKNGQANLQAKYGTGALFWQSGSNLTLFLRNGAGAVMTYSSGGNTYQGFSSYNNFRSWLLSATATNMAYMLSAQFIATYLNVNVNGTNGFVGVNASSIVYAPGTSSANSLGFATIGDLLNEAEGILSTGGTSALQILDGNSLRARAEAVKNALDKANNNLNFVQSTPCAFSF